MAANPYQSPEGDLTVDEDGFGEIRFFSPSSRIGRLRYFSHGMLITIAFYAALIPAAVLFAMGDVAAIVGGLIIGIAYLAVIVITVILMIQRLHDLDKTGWMALLMFVPLLNIFFAFYILFWPGTRGTNNFGLRPPPNKTWHWIVVLAIPVLLGILAAIAIPAYQDYVERAQAAPPINESYE